jgi:hypothetical protein
VQLDIVGGLTSSDYFAWIIAVGTGGQIIKSSDAGESVKEKCMRSETQTSIHICIHPNLKQERPGSALYAEQKF